MIIISVGSDDYNLEIWVEFSHRAFGGFDDGSVIFASSVCGVGEDVGGWPEVGQVVVLVHEVRNLVVQVDDESVGLSAVCGGDESLGEVASEDFACFSFRLGAHGDSKDLAVEFDPGGGVKLSRIAEVIGSFIGSIDQHDVFSSFLGVLAGCIEP